MAVDIFRKLDLRLNRWNKCKLKDRRRDRKIEGKKLPVYFPFPLLLLSISSVLIFYFLCFCFIFPFYFLFPRLLFYISPSAVFNFPFFRFLFPSFDFLFPLPLRSFFYLLFVLLLFLFSYFYRSLFCFPTLSPLASPSTQFRSETRRRGSTEHRPGQ